MSNWANASTSFWNILKNLLIAYDAMLQELPFISNWRQWTFWLVAGVLGSGVTTAIASRWLHRRELDAQVEQTDAAASELRIRAKVTEGDAIGRYMQWLQQAQERYDVLRGELVELQDRCAGLMNENTDVRSQLANAQLDIELKELFIGRLHAATKLGLELKDLPPSLDDVIIMLERMRDSRMEKLRD